MSILGWIHSPMKSLTARRNFKEYQRMLKHAVDDAVMAFPANMLPFSIKGKAMYNPQGTSQPTFKAGNLPMRLRPKQYPFLEEAKYEEYEDMTRERSRVKAATDWRWDELGRKINLDGKWEYNNDGGMWRTSFGMKEIARLSSVTGGKT